VPTSHPWLTAGWVPAAEKRNFSIAPPMCMKTKGKFRLASIAPTMLMKIHGLVKKYEAGHDVAETSGSYRYFGDRADKKYSEIALKNGNF
jgi:hypothetical protein